MKKIDIHNEKIDHPYHVPEGYFSQLSADILEKKSALKQSPVIWNKKIQYALVSAMVLFVALSIVFITSQSSQTPEELLSEVSNEEIIQYLSDYDLTDDEILSSYDNTTELEFNMSEDNLLEGLEIDESTLDEYMYELEFNENDLGI